MNKNGILAQPISRANIRLVAKKIREVVGFENEPYFPVIPFIEQVMPQIFQDFCHEILEDKEMPRSYAEALPQLNLLKIREDVYIGALSDNGRHRFTLAHEIGHFIFHGEGRVSLARSGETRIPAYQQPEWQANTFAGELLIPTHLMRGKEIVEIVNLCKVSRQAAEIQYKFFT
jgi:hypothetical protein